jgi:hypothetical protein
MIVVRTVLQGKFGTGGRLAAFRDSMASMQELVVSGRNELWTVEAEALSD